MKTISQPVTLRSVAKVNERTLPGSLKEFFKQATPRLRRKK